MKNQVKDSEMIILNLQKEVKALEQQLVSSLETYTDSLVENEKKKIDTIASVTRMMAEAEGKSEAKLKQKTLKIEELEMKLALLTKNSENLGNDILDMKHILAMEKVKKEELMKTLDDAKSQIAELSSNQDFEKKKSSKKVEELQFSNLNLQIKIDQLEVELINERNQNQKLREEFENTKAKHDKEIMDMERKNA